MTKQIMNTTEKKKTRSFRDFSPRVILQSSFLTAVFFIENNLTTCAASCAFGFLFSFIPILMMIAAILLHFLHASSDSISILLGADSFFSSALPSFDIIEKIASIRGTEKFEIVVVAFTIWMARNFFNSISSSLRQIYKARSVSRPVMNQIIVFAEELLVVGSAAILIFLSSTAQTIFSIPILPEIVGRLSQIVPIKSLEWLSVPTARIAIFLAPYIYICFFITAMYKSAGGGQRPSLRLSLSSALFCTLVFMAVQKAMSVFINVNRYNLVYGVFSRFIVMLLGVYVFFILFLFFAQFMFVVQFFDDLLLGELYLLQSRDRTAFFPKLRYKIFVEPDYFLKGRKSLFPHNFERGAIIYTAGSEALSAFYIAKGSVELSSAKEKNVLSKGSFFGEMSCVLKKPRDNTAKACENTIIIEIASEQFLSLLQKNSEASQKILEQIGAYYARIYGDGRNAQ